MVFLGLILSVSAQDMKGITGDGKMKDGKKVGKWVYTCDSTGAKVGTENYDGDGQLHGYQTWSNCDGYKISEYNYEHGIKMGKQKDYFEYGNRVKREWNVIERSKKCKKINGEKEDTDIEWYKEYSHNRKLIIELEGDPCGKRTITKYRESGGQEWHIRYDDNGQWIDGPRHQEREIFGPDLR